MFEKMPKEQFLGIKNLYSETPYSQLKKTVTIPHLLSCKNKVPSIVTCSANI